MEIVLLLTRIMLAAVFALAGAAKLLDLPGSRKSLLDFGVPMLLASPLAWLLPVMELAGAAALIADSSAQWGALVVSVLLISFLAAIGTSLARGRRPDCHCFGQFSSKPIGASTFVRNAILLALASLIVWKGSAYSGWSSFRGFTNYEISILVLVAALAGGLALTLFFLLQMLKQNGRLLVRLEAVETKLDIRPDEKPVAGLPVGAPNPYAPAGATKMDGTFLLVFTEAGCAACEGMQPEFTQWRTEYADRFSMEVIHSRETAQMYRVTGSPSAVLVVGGQIASPLAEGSDAIRALVKRVTLPPPVRKGERVPALQLPDLNGETVDLAALGRRTLLLFWSPGCGFCQQMLDDLKKWERARPQQAPELLIISSGTPAENRQQGIASPILLDQHLTAQEVLGAQGTPSAVIIDAQGVIASEVRAGAAEALALAANSESEWEFRGSPTLMAEV